MGFREQRDREMRAKLLFLALLMVPAASYAQDAQRDRLREAFPAEAVTQIERILAEAEAAGVPSQPLVAKALEGAAKRVPAPLVVSALSAYAERLQQATALVGPERGEAAVVAAADAMRRGVPADAIGTMAGQHEGDLAVPLVVLADLVEAGVPVEGAFNVVENALNRRQGPDEMLAIPGAVRRLVREGRLPAEAAAAVGRAIGSGLFPGIGNLQNLPGVGAPNGPPVPPGAGPPEHARKKGPPVDPPVGGPPPDGVL